MNPVESTNDLSTAIFFFDEKNRFSIMTVRSLIRTFYINQIEFNTKLILTTFNARVRRSSSYSIINEKKKPILRVSRLGL
jgi:hypothetical protein